MTQLANPGTHTDAVIDRLSGTMKTFDAGAPDLDATPGIVAAGTKGWGWQGTPGQSAFRPYRIVYPLTGGTMGADQDQGTLANPSDDASLIWQVTCVGATRPQCEAVVHDTNELLVEQMSSFTIPGRFVMRVWCDMTGGVRRDDELQHPVFIPTPRYRLDSTPLDGGH